MQISQNTTPMSAGLTMFTDKHGREYCVAVVKGTFTLRDDGNPVLSKDQEPLVYVDAHYGDASTTGIKYECDFAPFKPRSDVIANAHAFSPTGRAIKELLVSLEAGAIKKVIKVHGDRTWRNGVFGLRPSEAVPFTKMPLTYERAYGGSDRSHPKPEHHRSEMRNPVGVGFHTNADLKTIVGTSLPNLEDPRDAVRHWNDVVPPIGYGVIGRSWQPRIKHAGTYNDKWLKERSPFLPEDFDDQYFLSAPVDQQVAFLKGGELIRCINMAPGGIFAFAVPRVNLAIRFRFRDRELDIQPNLDTLIIEPDQRRFLVTWRANAPLHRKRKSLREVLIEFRSPTMGVGMKNGKSPLISFEGAIA